MARLSCREGHRLYLRPAKIGSGPYLQPRNIVMVNGD
jgi:hypothetical protein